MNPFPRKRRPGIPRLSLIIGLLVLFLPSVLHAETASHVPEPPLWIVTPFLVLLLAIAVMPFINRHWWERFFPHVSIALGAITTVYYILFLDGTHRMLHAGHEYVSFICLIGSLFVVAGGIHIRLRGYSTPLTNIVLLLFGAVLSNIVGTTGASMILIRPYIHNNKYRLHPYHIIFFIFIVSNMGGALTPIGDPPLFLGYLRGIPFFWVLFNLWGVWLFAIGSILAVFFLIDLRYYGKVPQAVREEVIRVGEHAKFEGWHNIFFLAVILVAVFISTPPFLREVLMLSAAAGSYYTTRPHIHRANHFNFFPIKEVGFLFLGLFATMVPALDWLELNSPSLGIVSASQFYWGTGFLSSFLDNAPTYLNFLSAEIGLFVTPNIIAELQALIPAGFHADLTGRATDIRLAFEALCRYHGDLVASGHVPLSDIQVSYLLAVHPLHVMAISIAAVFFGAMTYIGNAPNFMVRSIAEQLGTRMPSFFGYMIRYSIPILLPIFVLVWLIFFHG
ncbi:MAG: sodium:proton antiporter [Bacteroidota bacterium]|nr:sodium:proton antiporter [Bacteroidota bacterium]